MKIARVWEHLPSFLQTAWQLKDIADQKEGEKEPRIGGMSSLRDDSIHTLSTSPSRVVCGLLAMAGDYILFIQVRIVWESRFEFCRCFILLDMHAA